MYIGHRASQNHHRTRRHPTATRGLDHLGHRPRPGDPTLAHAPRCYTCLQAGVATWRGACAGHRRATSWLVVVRPANRDSTGRQPDSPTARRPRPRHTRVAFSRIPTGTPHQLRARAQQSRPGPSDMRSPPQATHSPHAPSTCNAPKAAERRAHKVFVPPARPGLRPSPALAPAPAATVCAVWPTVRSHPPHTPIRGVGKTPDVGPDQAPSDKLPLPT